MKILVPKRYVKAEDHDGPLFFLAGPVRGGGDWQRRMCLLLKTRVENPLIVCPCRWDENHTLASSFVDGKAGYFQRQLDFENHYLDLAGVGPKPGCIVFWLGIEDSELPHPGPEPFAMDTRRELGKWGYRLAKEDARVVIGADAGFYGLSQFERSITYDQGLEFKALGSMEETAQAAVDRAFTV